MSDRLKNVIQWTIYILIVLVALFTIISLLINVLAPTFFPKVNISGFKDYINTFGIILSFLSAVLGFYSIWQSFKSGRQANEMINSIHDLKQQQETLLVILKSTDNLGTVFTNRADGQWIKDDVTK